MIKPTGGKIRIGLGTTVGQTASQFDYIVVGSGAGGGPVAANLAEAGFRVLLLEAGDDPVGPAHEVPGFHGYASQDPAMRWDFWVRHHADEQARRRNSKYRERYPETGGPVVDGVLYPRASALGGCTAHHALITAYPHDNDWRRVADVTGDDGWSPDAMRRHFRTIEACRYRAPTTADATAGGHGLTGWLPTEWPDVGLIINDPDLRTVLVSAAVKHRQDRRRPSASPNAESSPAESRWRSLGFPDSLDLNATGGMASGEEGVYLVPLSTDRGRRSGTRERVLDVARRHPDRMKVELCATVTRIELEGESPVRATGVTYHKGERLYRAAPSPAGGRAEPGPPIVVQARREVILAAGVFNSPQLLMLSGIGPRAQLDKFRIEVRVALEGVGRRLQDRYEVTVVSRMARQFSLLFGGHLDPDRDDPYLRRWRDSRQGPYTGTGAVLAIVRRSAPDLPEPDLFLFGMPLFFGGYYPDYHRDVLAKGHDVFTWAILKGHTVNREGTVRLRSNDPFEPPLIDFNYFPAGNDDPDLKALVEAVRFVRSLGARPSQAHRLIRGELQPGDGVRSDSEVAAWIRDEAWGHHACGTCAIGASDDELAVLDSRCRVRGVAGLRIVDASIFPWIPGFFLALPIYMAAEKVSRDILADARKTADEIL